MWQFYYFLAVSCNEADKPCFCDKKGSSACNAVPHSSCDAGTKSCVCNEDFYNNLGTCTAAPSELCQHIVVAKIVPLHEIDLGIWLLTCWVVLVLLQQQTQSFCSLFGLQLV